MRTGLFDLDHTHGCLYGVDVRRGSALGVRIGGVLAAGSRSDSDRLQLPQERHNVARKLLSSVGCDDAYRGCAVFPVPRRRRTHSVDAGNDLGISYEFYTVARERVAKRLAYKCTSDQKVQCAI